MDIKVIKNEDDYNAALAEFDRLLDIDPADGTPESDVLDLLTVLLESYEADQHSIDFPDTVSAIEFVMDQRGYERRDLIPLIGSRSKVSEVLSGKRRLTREMCQALHEEWGIPAEILLRDPPQNEQQIEIDWTRFPVKEMRARAYLDRADKRPILEQLKEFFGPFGGVQASPLLCRQTHFIRAAKTNEYALEAWRGAVLHKAIKVSPPIYDSKAISRPFLDQLVTLSRLPDGPLRAREQLLEIGVVLVCGIKHFPKTYLDGAAFFAPSGNPVIALTLRHDRIDNFWFTLMHELIHVWKHLKDGQEMFVDDLDATDVTDFEEEADRLAGDILVPSHAWEDSEVRHMKSAYSAMMLAEELGIHPAIVAGKVRHENKNYRLLNQLLGHREVRKVFGFNDGLLK